MLALNIFGGNEFAVAGNLQVKIPVLSHPTQKQIPGRITATIHTRGGIIVFSCLYKNMLYFLKLEENRALWQI